MLRAPRWWNEKNIRLFFDVSLWAKGADAVVEMIGGAAAFFVTQPAVLRLVEWVTRDEFAEDPHDRVANALLQAAQNLSVGTEHFIAAYLFAHGVLKLWLIVGLLRKRLWYYPVALVVFGLFIAYQGYRYWFTHSAWLIAVTVLDLVVIVLTWHEWRYLHAHRLEKA